MEQATTRNKQFYAGAALALIALSLVMAGMIAFVSTASPVETQTAAAPSTFTGIELRAKSAMVLDMTNRKVLYEKNADVPLPLASLTKIMLALVISEALPLDASVTIPYYMASSDGKEHFEKGERWLLQDVIDFTLVTSSNNGAEILSDLAASVIRDRNPNFSSENPTLERMNKLANNLNLQQTYFLNVSGLDLSNTQAGSYGSARDMASLFAYAASANPELFAGTARGGVLLRNIDGNRNTTASNTNDVQGAIPGLIMGKTGFTDLAGGNLAVVFDVGLAHPVVAVVLGSGENERFTDMQKLVERARKAVALDPKTP